MFAPIGFLRSHAHQTSARWCVMCLLAALVCAQALGFMHQVVHDGHAGVHAHAGHDDDGHNDDHDDHAASHADGHSPGDAHGHAEAGWLQALFSQHDDATDCRAFDGIGLQFFACQAATALPLIAPSLARLRLLASDFVARWAALFDARGPPFSR